MRKSRPPSRRERLENMAAEIVDVEGAAQLLGVSKRTIYTDIPLSLPSGEGLRALRQCVLP